MHRLKNRGIVVLAVLGLLAFSGIAMASDNEETDPAADTIFNYDSDGPFLFWNVTSLDYEPDAGLLTESLFENYQDLLESCSLNSGADFDGYEIDGEELTLFDGDNEVDPESLDERCGELFWGDATGPNGQVNHGMFVKLFNELYDMYDGPAKRGCLIRHIAQDPELGKGDQQVKVSDVEEPDPGAEEEPIVGSFDFTTVQADCIKGKDGNGNGNRGKPEWAGNGKPPWAGQKGGPNSDLP